MILAAMVSHATTNSLGAAPGIGGKAQEFTSAQILGAFF